MTKTFNPLAFALLLGKGTILQAYRGFTDTGRVWTVYNLVCSACLGFSAKCGHCDEMISLSNPGNEFDRVTCPHCSGINQFDLAILT